MILIILSVKVPLRSIVHVRLFLAGFHGNSSFCLGEDEEVEIEVQEDFLSFDADLVAEQLTYMDAVSEGQMRRAGSVG